MVPPVLCISASAASPYIGGCPVTTDCIVIAMSQCKNNHNVRVYFVFVIFCCLIIISLFFFAPPSLPSLGSLVSSLLHQRDIEMLVSFLLFLFFSSVALPFAFYFLVFSCLPSSLVVMSSFCWSTTWTCHTTRRTSKQQTFSPQDSACALSACMIILFRSFCSFFSFHFLSVSVLFCPIFAFFCPALYSV